LQILRYESGAPIGLQCNADFHGSEAIHVQLIKIDVAAAADEFLLEFLVPEEEHTRVAKHLGERPPNLYFRQSSHGQDIPETMLRYIDPEDL
jgi:hypothetical protein